MSLSKKTNEPVLRLYRADGMAMLLVLGLLAAMSIGSATFFGLLNHDLARAHAVERGQVCMNLAEAGVDKAIAELRADPSKYTGEHDTSLGAGFFSVETSRLQGAREYRITSTGLLRSDGHVLKEVRVSADISFTPDGGVQTLRWSEKRP